jgi:hypothetical protein
VSRHRSNCSNLLHWRASYSEIRKEEEGEEEAAAAALIISMIYFDPDRYSDIPSRSTKA